MIGREEADRLIGRTLADEGKYAHSRRVAAHMERMAALAGEEGELWYLTGLLHDIDLPETLERLEVHGLLAEKKLEGLLPPVGIRAVMTHDYRTGLKPETLLGEALIYADMHEIVERTAGASVLEACRAARDWTVLEERYPGMGHHLSVLKNFTEKYPPFAD